MYWYGDKVCHLVRAIGNDKLYVLTGGPNSGKTTIIDELRNLGIGTVKEAAAEIITEQGKVVLSKRKAFQARVLERQLDFELAPRQADSLTFLDRGILDGIAYFRVHGEPIPHDFNSIVGILEDADEEPLYKLALVLDTVPVWNDNGIRTEDLDFSRRIADLMAEIYSEAGVPVVRVPVLPVPERVEFILSAMVGSHFRKTG